MESTIRDQLINELPRLRSIVRKVSYDQGITDDIFQECCTRIIEKEHLCNRDLNKIRSWMSVVTRNTTLTLLQRRKKTKEGHSLIEEPHMKNESSSDFSEDHIRWLVKEFDQLNDRQKEILRLRYFDQMKLKDIGERLGINHSTVVDHINRALNKMKKNARKEGLMALLLPWNWNFKSIGNFLYKWIFLNAATEICSTLVVLSTVAFISVKVFEFHYIYTSPKLSHQAVLSTKLNNKDKINTANTHTSKSINTHASKNASIHVAPTSSLIDQILKENYSSKYHMKWKDEWSGNTIITLGKKLSEIQAFVVKAPDSIPESFLLHGKKRNKDQLNFDMLSKGIPAQQNPVAILEYISTATNDLVIKKFEMDIREAGTVFQADIMTPKNLKTGTIRLLMYYPASPLKIKPAVYEVKVYDPLTFR